MWRKSKNTDEETQDFISRQVRKWTRGSWLNKAAESIAVALAKLLIRPKDGMAKVSFIAGLCSAPHGQVCKGCDADGSCPSTYATCTTYNALMGCRGLCPHPSGWWYTSDPVGFRTKCTDCVSSFVQPYTQGNWCYKGAHIGGEYVICGCRSTLLY
ncbi:hypothetical protein M3231_06665 [Neobacillus mesonae]|nr:hypothetical protein [Neobacillus mesonae]